MHIEEALSLKETELKLHEAINKLPSQQKQGFTLCKLEGKSYEETGMILGIATSTVNSQMVKSNRYIKVYLQKYLDFTIAILLLCSFHSK